MGLILDLPRQRWSNLNVDGAVTVFDVKDHGVSARLRPVRTKLNARALPASARQVEWPRPQVSLGKGRLFHDRLRFQCRGSVPSALLKLVLRRSPWRWPQRIRTVI